MKNKLSESLSLINRMDKHLTVTEAEEIKKSIQKGIGHGKNYPHKNDFFDLDKIPMGVLDKAWGFYSSYIDIAKFGPYCSKLVTEDIDYKKNLEVAKEKMLNLFPIMSTEQFSIIERFNGLFCGVIVPNLIGNEESIIEAMNDFGFFNSRRIEKQNLCDGKERVWVSLYFEPCEQDDVTAKIREFYSTVYHISPSIFAKSIKKNGLIPSNNNPIFHYNEPRVYVTQGEPNKEELQRIVDDLYIQAKKKNIKNLNPNYTIFYIALNRLNDTIRFYYDINEPKGIFTKTPIPPEAFFKIENIEAEEKDILSTDKNI